MWEEREGIKEKMWVGGKRESEEVRTLKRRRNPRYSIPSSFYISHSLCSHPPWFALAYNHPQEAHKIREYQVGKTRGASEGDDELNDIRSPFISQEVVCRADSRQFFNKQGGNVKINYIKKYGMSSTRV